MATRPLLLDIWKLDPGLTQNPEGTVIFTQPVASLINMIVIVTTNVYPALTRQH